MNIPDMPEAIFRRIWQAQLFSTDHLVTRDGREVRILFPGKANTDAGPDFLDAKIRIGTTSFRGDVELHINAEEWLSHKHDMDPHYNRVILHVVMSADPLSPPARTASRRPIPLLVLHPFLDEKFRSAWMSALADEESAGSHSLVCAEHNADVSAKVITSWLERLATERIELKLRRFEERLKQLVDETRHVVREPYPRYYGNPSEIPPPRNEYTKKEYASRSLWEQLLYEGIMEAMGYSKNQKPFLDLARSVRLAQLREPTLDGAQAVMGVMFGAAGLLPPPKQIPEKASREYVGALRKIWSKRRKHHRGGTLNEGDWLFFRLRPNNFPTARLAAICFLLPTLFGEESFRDLIRLLKDASMSTKSRLTKLHQLFAFEPDDFWQSHFHFKRKDSSLTRSPAGIRLGAGRINDIVVNAMVPIALLYARVFKVSNVGRNARALLTSIPATQENSITEIIQNQLAREKVNLSTAMLQQGAIQLHRAYCEPTRCGECPIGRKLKDLRLKT